LSTQRAPIPNCCESKQTGFAGVVGFVGSTCGGLVGGTVGNFPGCADGASEGGSVGFFDGLFDGAADGGFVGLLVGTTGHAPQEAPL
jgi:hypothetical protein